MLVMLFTVFFELLNKPEAYEAAAFCYLECEIQAVRAANSY